MKSVFQVFLVFSQLYVTAWQLTNTNPGPGGFCALTILCFGICPSLIGESDRDQACVCNDDVDHFLLLAAAVPLYLCTHIESSINEVQTVLHLHGFLDITRYILLVLFFDLVLRGSLPNANFGPWENSHQPNFALAKYRPKNGEKSH